MILAVKGTVASAGDTVFLVIQNNQSPGEIYYSLDGSTFTNSSYTLGSTGYAAYADDDLFVTCGDLGSYRISTNGLDYSGSTLASVSIFESATSDKAGTYALAGYLQDGISQRPRFYYSTDDGASWTAKHPSGTSFRIRASLYANNLWIVAGLNTAYATTPNMATGWTARTAPTTSPRGLAYGSSLYVMVGENGDLYTSSTGTGSWTSRTSGFSTSDIYGVASDGTNFVAVGVAGKISDSTNGTTWTARTSGTAENLRAVTYSATKGLWIAVGDNDTILTSTNRTSWTLYSTDLPNTDDLYGVGSR